MGPTGELGGIRKWWRTQPSPQSSLQILQPGCDQGSRDTGWLESPAQSSRASSVSKTSSFNNILSGRKDVNAKKIRKIKKVFTPHCCRQPLRAGSPSAAVFLQVPLQFFPFLSNYALAALPSLENICTQLPVEATSPPPHSIQLCR